MVQGTGWEERGGEGRLEALRIINMAPTASLLSQAESASLEWLQVQPLGC